MVLDLINKKFGNLLVISKAEKPKHLKSNNTYWNCICDCFVCKILEPKTSIIRGTALTSGKSTKCVGNIPDLRGQVFNKLTIINLAFVKSSRAYWLCKCSCKEGNIITAHSAALRIGNVKSCGCLISENNSKTKTTTDINEAIKINARKILAGWYSDGNLILDDFLQLTKQNCYYCGEIPKNIMNVYSHSRYDSNREWTNNLIKNANFVYNGLDRVDSNKPHNLNNVVPCCIICNRYKSDLAQNIFLEKIKLLKDNISIITCNNLSINYLYYDFLKKFNFKNKFNQNIIAAKIAHIKDAAKRRKLSFELANIEALKLIINPCIYCNFIPNPEIGLVIGIDRLNNLQGYTKENSVSACKNCNIGKNSLTFDEFASWCKKVKQFQLQKVL